MRKTLLFLVLFSLGFAKTGVDVRQEQSLDRSKTLEKGQQEREVRERENRRGGENRSTRESGVRDSVREEVQRALKEMESKSVRLSLSLPAFLFQTTGISISPEDFYVIKLRDGALVYQTSLEFVERQAKARGYAKGIVDEDRVRSLMTDLIKLAGFLRTELLKLKDLGTLGLEDVERIVRNLPLERAKDQPVSFNTRGDCYMWGDLYRVKCGDCILDFSMQKGMPELYCKGLAVFTEDSIMGYRAVIEVSKNYSIDQIYSTLKSKERYSSAVNTIASYTAWMEREGQATEATLLKKLALQSLSRDSRSFNQAVELMEKKEEPSKVINILKR